MKRIIQTRLLLFMTLGLLSLLIVVFLVMTVGAKRLARVTITERLRDLSMDVTEWRSNYKKIRENTDSSSLAKARMLARIIQYDPEILKNDARLKELADVLNVDSLCVSDGEGVLIASTEPGFLGFHMDSTEQSGAFMPAVKDKTFELVQDPQERGIDHVIVQYAGVARLDEPGIVQIAYESDNVFDYSDIELMREIMKALPIGQEGRFLVLEDGDDPVVFASGDTSENGCRLSELGFYLDPVLPDSVFIRGKPYFCQRVQIPDEPRRVLAVLPKGEVYGARNRAMAFLICIFLGSFAFFFYLLDRLIRRTVTDGFYEVNRALDKIIAGDLTQTVSVRSNPEFLTLSDGINTMVGGLKKNLTDSRRRVKRENELAKSIQQTLIPASGQVFAEFSGLDFASASVLAAHKGSDVFEPFVTDAGRPGFVMVETIGDSVSACLSMMKFRAIFQPCALAASGPLDMLNRGMEVFKDEKVFKKQFLSIFVGFLDPENRRLDYVNAGFYPPFLRRADGSFEQLRDSAGAVFTTARPVEFRQESITFGPGDVFFACSNGIFSYRDREGQLFTKKMLLNSLNGSKADSSQALIDDVMSNIRGVSGELPPDDDVIMAAIRFQS
ncbi:MAG: SpoIIE family protein phosphatase [Lentisphaeria bacterium]|nr:SpoIIE family protein phosphatase [Lentisphaeria bacterium]